MKPIELLRRLQAGDHEWDEKARLYQSVKQRLSDRSELEDTRGTQRQSAEKLANAQSQLRDGELRLESLQEKTRGVEADLYSGRIRSPRELENLRKDSVQLRRQLSGLEDRVLLRMAEVDELESAASRGEEELGAFERRWADEQEALAAQYAALRGRLRELQEIRAQLRGSMGLGELRLYDELRAKKGGMALSPMKAGICQTCRVRLPSYKVQVVEAGEAVVTCEGCGRIVYQE